MKNQLRELLQNSGLQDQHSKPPKGFAMMFSPANNLSGKPKTQSFDISLTESRLRQQPTKASPLAAIDGRSTAQEVLKDNLGGLSKKFSFPLSGMETDGPPLAKNIKDLFFNSGSDPDMKPAKHKMRNSVLMQHIRKSNLQSSFPGMKKDLSFFSEDKSEDEKVDFPPKTASHLGNKLSEFVVTPESQEKPINKEMKLARAHTGFHMPGQKMNPYLGFYSRIKEKEKPLAPNVKNVIASTRQNSTRSKSRRAENSAQQTRPPSIMKKKVDLDQDQLYDILRSPIEELRNTIRGKNKDSAVRRKMSSPSRWISNSQANIQQLKYEQFKNKKYFGSPRSLRDSTQFNKHIIISDGSASNVTHAFENSMYVPHPDNQIFDNPLGEFQDWSHTAGGQKVNLSKMKQLPLNQIKQFRQLTLHQRKGTLHDQRAYFHKFLSPAQKLKVLVSQKNRLSQEMHRQFEKVEQLKQQRVASAEKLPYLNLQKNDTEDEPSERRSRQASDSKKPVSVHLSRVPSSKSALKSRMSRRESSPQGMDSFESLPKDGEPDLMGSFSRKKFSAIKGKRLINLSMVRNSKASDLSSSKKDQSAARTSMKGSPLRFKKNIKIEVDSHDDSEPRSALSPSKFSIKNRPGMGLRLSKQPSRYDEMNKTQSSQGTSLRGSPKNNSRFLGLDSPLAAITDELDSDEEEESFTGSQSNRQFFIPFDMNATDPIASFERHQDSVRYKYMMKEGDVKKMVDMLDQKIRQQREDALIDEDEELCVDSATGRRNSYQSSNAIAPEFQNQLVLNKKILAQQSGGIPNLFRQSTRRVPLRAFTTGVQSNRDIFSLAEKQNKPTFDLVSIMDYKQNRDYCKVRELMMMDFLSGMPKYQRRFDPTSPQPPTQQIQPQHTLQHQFSIGGAGSSFQRQGTFRKKDSNLSRVQRMGSQMMQDSALRLREGTSTVSQHQSQIGQFPPGLNLAREGQSMLSESGRPQIAKKPTFVDLKSDDRHPFKSRLRVGSSFDQQVIEEQKAPRQQTEAQRRLALVAENDSCCHDINQQQEFQVNLNEMIEKFQTGLHQNASKQIDSAALYAKFLKEIEDKNREAARIRALNKKARMKLNLKGANKVGQTVSTRSSQIAESSKVSSAKRDTEK